jgi:lysophospholipase L1-like esterase
VRWVAIEPAAVEGQGWRDVQSPFDRLPGRAERLVRSSVWELARHAAGLYAKFITDAPAVRVRWTLTSDELSKPHMPASGVSGVDLYTKRDGNWYFAGAGIPRLVGQNEAVVVAGLDVEPREFLLYLPLYNGVSQVDVGVPDRATLEFMPPSAKRPIVFYGTSITQGGCASRAGMSYSAILGRRLNVPVVNLGFSGNGKAEPEIARLIAELDPAAFVLDPLGNLETEQVAERLPPFIAILRERHPRTPILLHENVYYPTTQIVPARLQRVEASNAVLRSILRNRLAEGDRNISIIPACDLTTDDGATTVDGTHPTDLGFVRMADAMEPYLRQYLGEGW